MSKKEKSSCPTVSVGGEALMEGIMMRGPQGAAMSLRLPDGSIETTMKEVKSPKEKCKILGFPFIRGPVSFIDSMIFGYKCLMESAEKTAMATETDTDNMSKLDKWIEDHFGHKMMTAIGVIGTVLGFGIAFLLFVWMPAFLFDTVNDKLAHGGIAAWKTVFEGVLRIILFIVYMSLVSRMKEIRRVFMYHGAEHKSIFCYEHGLELTVENVRKQIRFHPRCGTSFIFLTLLLSILISSIVASIFPQLRGADLRWLWIIVKVLLLPVIMSLGYEFIRIAGKHGDNILVKIIAAPGLWVQRITTKEPTDDIIEVGICALKAALGMPVEMLIKPEGAEEAAEIEAEMTPEPDTEAAEETAEEPKAETAEPADEGTEN
ncbi:MAG: DUF1385 domain-containing protein [Clostridiales bacterium]|nr:DUF1385 domain-containing protein [Clostridiales bacterium]